MPTPAFFALFRDISKLAAAAADDLAAHSTKMAAATDDIAALSAKAGIKTAGVAGDDLAVGAGQVSGVSPNRELPALWRIAKGSALNKLWLGALLLAAGHFFPLAITAALVAGGLYLAYEGGEALLDLIKPSHLESEPHSMSEDDKVKGAINTDRILSLEMGIIALSAAGNAPLSYKIATLFIVGLVMTIGVYGIIALIIRLDDMGLALARSNVGFKQLIGQKMVNAAPVILRILGPIGMVAMFGVAGGIILHTAHIEIFHWALSLGADVLCGTVVGLFLAYLHIIVLRIRNT